MKVSAMPTSSLLQIISTYIGSHSTSLKQDLGHLNIVIDKTEKKEVYLTDSDMLIRGEEGDYIVSLDNGKLDVEHIFYKKNGEEKKRTTFSL
jgi:hypothetical protein